MIEQIKAILRDNNFAQGGLFLMFGGSILGIVWKILNTIRILYRKIFFVEVTTVSTETTFYYLQHWLDNTTFAKRFCSSIIASKYNDKEIFQPSYGGHIFFHKWRLYYLDYILEEKNQQRTERMTLAFWALFKKREKVKEILKQGKELLDKGEYTGTKIYVSSGSYWEHQLQKEKCFIPILSGNKMDQITNDINDFNSNEKWYIERGINYKRGYLLYGPPGNGKTTCILSLAQKFEKNLYILNLADGYMTERTFMSLIGNVPKNAFLCIEDIDATSSTVERINKETINTDDKTVSLSTILNTLDGLFTPHGLIFFMTTNHIEKLDTALIRHGRIDLKTEFKNANEEQIKILFSKYFTSEAGLNEFIAWGNNRSVSEVHAKLIEHKGNIETLLKDLHETPERTNDGSGNSEMERRGHTNSRNKTAVCSSPNRFNRKEIIQRTRAIHSRRKPGEKLD